MANSKEALSKIVTKTEDPNFDINKTPNSRGFRKIYDNAYKPGFIDKATPESFKMSVDRELGEISKALFKTGERDSDLSDENQVVKEVVEELKVEVGEGSAAVTELKRVVASNTLAIAETKLELSASITDVNSKITVTNKAVADLEKSTAEQITQLESNFNGDTSSIRQELSTISSDIHGIEAKWAVTADVNGRVAGVELINGTKGSEFNILADKFRVYNGTTDDAVFEIVGGKTRIKNAVVGDLYSDNWDGANTGWGINKDGTATFNSVKVRGEVNATSGVFNNVTISDNCTINASAKIKDAQVDTLQIAGNAVTIPSFVEVLLNPSIDVSVSSGDVDVSCEINNVVYNSDANLVFICSGLAQGNGTTNFGVVFEIYRNGSLFSQKRFGTTAVSGFSNVHTFMTNSQIMPGTYTFKAKVFNSYPSGTFTLKSIAMSVLGAKR